MPTTKTKSRKTARRPIPVPTAGVEQTKPVQRLMFRLGGIITDSATSLKGMLTHYVILIGGSAKYIFQPHGLSPESGEPVDNVFLEPIRIQGGEVVPEPALPLEVLGTEAEDMASGFKGTVIELCLHISGCIHVVIQPKGPVKKTGEIHKAHGFDIRRCKGVAIKPMTEPQRQEGQKEKPSPMGVSAAPRPTPGI
jgi:hypothetical protein